MKKSIKKNIFFIIVFIIIIITIISIIIIKNKNKSKIYTDNEKVYYEMKYLDSEIINMTNNLYYKNAIINWSELESRIEKIYNYWNSTILDLNNFNINKKALTDFGKILDNTTISIKNRDKKSTLGNLTKLYYQLTIYYTDLNIDINYINIVNAKYNLLYAYSIVENGNWTLTYEYILKSDENLFKTVNSINNSQSNQYNINQAYIAIKELENIINVKDIDIFYIKYNIAMNKLQNI